MAHPLGQAALLGTIQGLTEFLPVSSDGHLALAEILFGIEHAGLTLNVMLHAGTFLATLIMLRQKLVPAVVEGARAIAAPSRFGSSSGARDALVVVLASMPTAVIGLLLRDRVERWTSSPLAVGLGFAFTGALLISTRWAKPGDREQPSWLGAVAIGVAQGLAVLPGVSRSGSTITLALWLGVRPDRAFELSMLMSLPAVFGAVALELPKLSGAGGGYAFAAVGALAAFGVGIVALGLLRRIVMRGHFAWFALWVLPLALATLALSRAWPRG